MTWYLVFRGLCILSFVLAVGFLLIAVGSADEHGPWGRWLAVSIFSALVGCLLLGVGWS